MITKKYKIQVKNLDLENDTSTTVKLKTNNINKQIKIDIIGGRIYSLLTLDDWYNNVPTTSTRTMTITLPNTNFYLLFYLTPNPNTGVYPKTYTDIVGNNFSFHIGYIGYEYNTDGTSGRSYMNVTRPGGKPGCIGIGWYFYRYTGGSNITVTLTPCPTIYSYTFGGYYTRPDSATIKQFGIAVVPMNTPTWDFLNNYWISSWNYDWGLGGVKWFSKNLNNTAVPLMEYIIKYTRVRKTNNDTYWK